MKNKFENNPQEGKIVKTNEAGEEIVFKPGERDEEVRDSLKNERAEGPVGEVFQRIDEAYEVLLMMKAGRTPMDEEGFKKALFLLDEATDALSKVSKKENE